MNCVASDDQRVALITGSAGGIGQETVSEFLSHGWTVIGIDRSQAQATGNNFYPIAIDISSTEADAAIANALDYLDVHHIHAVVNNAATQVSKSLLDTSTAEWDTVMATNVRSVLMTSKAAVPLMGAGSAVVNVSSVHAIATSRGIAAYAASKGALLALTRAMALELAPIRVNAILPGAIDTSMLRAGLTRRPGEGSEEDAIRLLGHKTPLGRVGHPQEIARSIYFLSDSSQTSFVTGQALTADGGATSRLSTE